MRVLNFGSVNIDHVYAVDHLARAGETLCSLGYRRFAGGKGFNQSVALARAGAAVCHAGRVGPDGGWLLDRLRQEGVDTAWVKPADVPTGHALIQVDRRGENAIVLFPGANHEIRGEFVAEVLSHFGPGGFLVLQNEVSAVGAVIAEGARRGLAVVFNAAPFTPDVLDLPLDQVRYLIVNETEGAALSGEGEPEGMVAGLRAKFPRAAVVLTLGREGVLYGDADGPVREPARAVECVDTTGAGDTFLGFFLAELLRGTGVRRALRVGCDAATLCVTRPGAADSIPRLEEVLARSPEGAQYKSPGQRPG
jgi:ribokinase